MNKEMRDILAAIEAKTAEAKTALAAGETEKSAGIMSEVEDLQKQYDLAKKIFEAEQKFAGDPEKGKTQEPETEPKKDSVKAFADAARKRFKTMSVGEDDEGGYTVPQDIQTRINQYRDATFNLRQLVRVETVTAPTGSRIFQVKGSQAAWTSIGEGTAIGVKNTPTFERATYSIKKYGGIFPVTNELLKDSDANITRVLTEWIGDGSRVTGNSLILTAIATKSQTNLADLEGIKKALIKTLGQAYMPTSSIVTNDDGLLYLSTLQDGNGRDLLSPDPFRPMELWLSVGAVRVPIKVIPNGVLATSNNKVPFIIGDLKEGIWFFDYNQTAIVASNTAIVGSGENTLNAFEQDLTLFRALEREDVVVRDANAFVNGYITVSA